MGTTVTTNLALIKPDTAESIQENLPTFAGWAAQNGINMDKLDALFRASTGTYTATWGSSGVAPTLGAGGFAEGKYIRFLPRMVMVFFRIFAGGAGFAAGTGTYNIALPPVAMDPAFATPSVFSDTIPIGKMVYQDNSAVLTSSVFPLNYLPSANGVQSSASVGGTWSATVPVVPAQNDRFSGYFEYPTAVP